MFYPRSRPGECGEGSVLSLCAESMAVRFIIISLEPQLLICRLNRSKVNYKINKRMEKKENPQKEDTKQWNIEQEQQQEQQQ
jgi:hypothetical protein